MKREGLSPGGPGGVGAIIAVVFLLLGPSAAAAELSVRVLTLDEALRIAREHQPQLRQARAATAVATARARESRSGLLPQATLTLGYQRTTANVIPRPGFVSPPSTGASWDSANSFSGSIGVNQLIWDFNQTLGKWRSGQSLARAQSQTEVTVTAQVALAVRVAYFSARTNKALAAVARDTLQNLERHLEQTRAFVDAGTHPEIDLAQARTNLANGRAQLVAAENAYQVAKAQLNQAMGVPSPGDYDVADNAPVAIDLEDGALEPLVDEAVKSRPEIVVLKLQAEAQGYAIRSAKGAYWPSLSANIGSTQGGTALDNLGWNVAAGIALSWPIFQGLLTDAQVAEAKASADQLAAQLELARQQVEFDVAQARLGVRAAKAMLAAQMDAVENAREQLRLAEGRYQSGVGNSVEFSDAQVLYTSAQGQVILADNQLATARAQLLRALGRR